MCGVPNNNNKRLDELKMVNKYAHTDFNFKYEVVVVNSRGDTHTQPAHTKVEAQKIASNLRKRAKAFKEKKDPLFLGYKSVRIRKF